MGVLSPRSTQNARGKTTRAFRTIGEASEELGLQPHVLRFWESKFSQIQPMKRGGGRRFYRPEDIEFIRGIKTLLHEEKHPIKDVQKLIRSRGAQSIVELGRSVEKASRERAVEDTVLVPDRIRKEPDPTPSVPEVVADSIPVTAIPQPAPAPLPPASAEVRSSLVSSVTFAPEVDREALEEALRDLEALRGRWATFLGDA